MNQLDTVRVVRPSADNPNDYALINQSDFNAEIHTLWTETQAEPETVASDRVRKTKPAAAS